MIPFPPTDWTVILQATINGDSSARSAWELFYCRYERVIRDLLRCQPGVNGDNIADLMQQFMEHLLEHSTVRRADPSRGRFRTFLRGVLQKFVSTQNAKARAKKRGGGVDHVPLDEAPETEAPLSDDEFDSAWAMGIFEQAFEATEQAWRRRHSNGTRFDVLQAFLPGSAQVLSREEALLRLGISPAALEADISRLNRLWAESVRALTALTVSRPDEVSDEVDRLCRAVVSWRRKKD